MSVFPEPTGAEAGAAAPCPPASLVEIGTSLLFRAARLGRSALAWCPHLCQRRWQVQGTLVRAVRAAAEISWSCSPTSRYSFAFWCFCWAL